MNVSIERKKEEALQRMKLLGVFPQTVKSFDQYGQVSISEPPHGAFYWAEGEDLKLIKDFEEEHNALVYVVVRSFTTLGKMDALLYISDHEDEWEEEREDLKNGEAFAYVYNHDMPDCSEFGCIGVARTIAAGIRRTW